MPQLPILIYILIFTLIGSVLSLIGGVILIMKEKIMIKMSHLLISLAAGTLLGTAFFDLLPEAVENANGIDIFFWTLIGIIFFFLLERFIYWFHFHEDFHEEKKPIVSLIILGDSVHNLIDGIVIAATFLVSIPLGIVTAFAVGAHEIPQEIGDFGVLLHNKVPKMRIIIYNLLSALVSLVGAVLTFYFRENIQNYLPIFLSLTAGFFIYIASSDLIPEIHHEKRKNYAIYETCLLLIGVALIFVVIGLLE